MPRYDNTIGEKEMEIGEQHSFIARYASKTLTHASFPDLGDELVARGFDMTRARANAHGVLLVPHRDRRRQAARVFKVLAPVEEAVKEDEPPMSLDVAAAMLAGAEFEAGMRPAPGLSCRVCGAVHPEGVVCFVPILYEVRCCVERTYPHEGPHEAVDGEGLVTHRWIEELVITDLPYNFYGPTDNDEEEYA
jgi:hypothetical protein